MEHLIKSNYSETMDEIFHVMEFTLEYLPRLKSTLYQKLEGISEIENMAKTLIEYGFSNYELYLINSLNNNSLPQEFQLQFEDLKNNKQVQFTAIALHHEEMLSHIKKSLYNELEKKLLTDIFRYYKESTLFLKSSRDEFKLIKSIVQ